MKTESGVRVVNLDQIQEVTFDRDCKPAGIEEEFRNFLTLNLNWNHATPRKSAKVGLFYVQKGFRGIASYKIDLDGNSNAVVKLQATLVNDLADIDDVSLNLVVGVPTFEFKDTLDPIALQQNLAQVSAYLQNGTDNRIASQFGNALMTQMLNTPNARAADSGGAGASGVLGSSIAETSSNEDLFIFRVEHVTLRKGERMILPVAEFTLPYRDVFTLELPFGPPSELRGNLGMEQERELARLLSAPTVMHKIRLLNHSKYPLTTAPALILRDGRVLAQGLMTYTTIGASVDLGVTAAVDIAVKSTNLETKRTPDAIRENGNPFSRVDLTGKITLTNHRARNLELEVTRYVLGAADHADHEGQTEAISAFENGDWLTSNASPSWWGWYSWLYWWNRHQWHRTNHVEARSRRDQSPHFGLRLALFLAVTAGWAYLSFCEDSAGASGIQKSRVPIQADPFTPALSPSDGARVAEGFPKTEMRPAGNPRFCRSTRVAFRSKLCHERVSGRPRKRSPTRPTHGRARRARNRHRGKFCPLRRPRRAERQQGFHLRHAAAPAHRHPGKIPNHPPAGTQPLHRPPSAAGQNRRAPKTPGRRGTRSH